MIIIFIIISKSLQYDVSKTAKFVIIKTPNNNPLGIYKQDDEIAYVNEEKCPLLYIFPPDQDENSWTMFCKYAQKVSTQENTLLRAIAQSDQAKSFTQDPRYQAYNCTIDEIDFDPNGANNCCCVSQNFDTSISTSGLVAVIVVPVLFLLAGFIMYKLNLHNSREAWILHFEQYQQKA